MVHGADEPVGPVRVRMDSLDEHLADEGTECRQFCCRLAVDRPPMEQKIDLSRRVGSITTRLAPDTGQERRSQWPV